MECGFAGNADIYGIGIRIGYYTQAVAVWFATFFHYSEAQGLRDVNKIFLFALVVAGLIYVFNARATHVVEAFLLLQIGLVIGLNSMLDAWRYSSRYQRASVENVISRLAIMGAGLLFNICFWWRGLDVMLATPCHDDHSTDTSKRDIDSTSAARQATYIWFFVRFSIYGWIRTFARVLSLYLVVGSSLTLGFADAVKLLQRWRSRKSREAFLQAAGIHHEFSGDGNNMSESHNTAPIISIANHDAHGREDLPSALPSIDRSQVRGDPLGDEDVTSEPQGNTQQHLDPLKDKIEIFSAVKQAENFLDLVFSIYSKKTVPHSRNNVIRGWTGSVRWHFPQNNQRYEYNAKKCLYSTCLWIWLRMQWARKPTLSQRWTLSLHILGLKEYSLRHVPRIYHRIQQLTETSNAPDWHILAIASDIQLSQIPSIRSPRVWVGMAVQKLSLITMLIIQVELTIAWNNISGLQRFDTLGQLIPFILGVGGLMKVLWSKWCLLRSGIVDNRDMEKRITGEYELAMEEYLRWKATL